MNLPRSATPAVGSLLLLAAAFAHAAKYSGEGDIQPKPLTPEGSLQRFHIEPGLRIELVAAEPLVNDPTDIAWDEKGRMFVTELSSYNQPEKSPVRSRIRVLEDKDGDGRMDTSRLFADGLDGAQGLLPMKGGLLVTTQSGILFLRDRDEDGVADATEVLFLGTEALHADAQMSSPRRGLDNWIYINNGLGGKVLHRPAQPETKLNLGNFNLRYHPLTGAFTLSSGRGQFGNTFDDWGRQFFSMNRNPAMLAVLPHEYLTRNSAAFLTEGHEDVAPAGGEAKVYPLKTFRTTSSAHAGTFTAACGTGVYRGDLLPTLAGSLFVCEPTGELVSRWVLEPADASFTARRAQPGVEFLTSDDEWFRPVNVTTGPDGALYIVDMYRRFIDGARFFPDDYIAANDMAAGSDKGRIYRIVPDGKISRRTVAPLPRDPTALVVLLEHPNSWQRETAQRLLVERGDAAVTPELEKMLAQSTSPRGRLHALWTLEGLGRLKAAHVRAALADTEPGVVENALWLAPRFTTADQTVRSAVLKLAASAQGRVRFAALLVSGGLDRPDAASALVRAGLAEADDAWMRAAILSSPVTQTAAVLGALLAEPSFTTNATAGRAQLVSSLAGILGARGDTAALQPLFAALADEGGDAADDWWKIAAISGLADGLRKSGGGSLAALLTKPPPALAASVGGVRRMMEASTRILADRTQPLNARLAAVPMLEHLPEAEATARIPPLLGSREPPALQKAVLAVLMRLPRRTSTALLYQHWEGLGATVRVEAMPLLARSPMELLAKIEEGVIRPALVGAETRWVIANSKSDEVRALGERVFGKIAGDRKELVKRYTSAIAGLPGDAGRGQQVFRNSCAVCHRFRGDGADVGPDISDVGIKSPDMLLADILDPNGTVEPRWEAYTVKAKGDRTFTALMASESAEAIVIKLPGMTETISRADIESTAPLGVSLMPPGLEFAIDEKQMADLLAFLRRPTPQKQANPPAAKEKP